MDRVAAVVQRTAPGARAWERRFDDDGDDMSRQRVIARTAPRLEFALPADAPVAACLGALEALPVRVGVGGTDLEDVFLRVGDEEERRRANLLSALPPARVRALVESAPMQAVPAARTMLCRTLLRRVVRSLLHPAPRLRALAPPT